jgi:hypothetical protein
MALFRCRKFLGCVPLRTGVWLLTLIAMIVSGPGSAGSWLEVFWMSAYLYERRTPFLMILCRYLFSTPPAPPT